MPAPGRCCGRASPRSTSWSSPGLSTRCEPPYSVFAAFSPPGVEALPASVEVYTTPYCPYCVAAKDLLRRKGVDFIEINVAGDRTQRARMVERASGRVTVPQIFIGETHVGGCDDLYALDDAGALDPLLAGSVKKATG